jgi:hypothetical protein
MNDTKKGNDQGAIILRKRHVFPFSFDVLKALVYVLSYAPL